MSKKLHTEILVGATAEQVWRVLTDLNAYHLWNPFIVEAKGRAAVGERLSLRMQPVGGSAMTFTPRVLEAEPGRRLRWLGRMVLPGVLDADHTFTIEPLAVGVRLIQRETFTGVLVPVLAGQFDRGTLPAFDLMNHALKERVEHAALAA